MHGASGDLCGVFAQGLARAGVGNQDLLQLSHSSRLGRHHATFFRKAQGFGPPPPPGCCPHNTALTAPAPSSAPSTSAQRRVGRVAGVYRRDILPGEVDRHMPQVMAGLSTDVRQQRWAEENA